MGYRKWANGPSDAHQDGAPAWTTDGGQRPVAPPPAAGGLPRRDDPARRGWPPDHRPASPNHRPVTPHDTGAWSSRDERWIPQRPPEEPEFLITRYDDPVDHARHRDDPGRVLDHDDWYELPPRPNGYHTGQFDTAGRAGMSGADAPPAWTGTGSWPQASDRLPEWADRADGWADRTDHVDPGAREDYFGWASPAGRDRADGRGDGRADGRADGRGAGWAGEADRRQAAVATRPEPPNGLLGRLSGYPAAVVATVGWYALPVLLYLIWSLLLGGGADSGCVDAAGVRCLSPRAEALHDLGGALSPMAVAVALSSAFALFLRWIAGTWRALTVGFAAAVVGAGLTTILLSIGG